jgi:hypothetical protein
LPDDDPPRLRAGIGRARRHLRPRASDLRFEERPVGVVRIGKKDRSLDREPVDDALQLVSGAEVVPVVSGQIEDDSVSALEQNVDRDLPEGFVTQGCIDRIRAIFVLDVHVLRSETTKGSLTWWQSFGRPGVEICE